VHLHVNYAIHQSLRREREYRFNVGLRCMMYERKQLSEFECLSCERGRGAGELLAFSRKYLNFFSPTQTHTHARTRSVCTHP
jgi:hypothetical protein